MSDSILTLEIMEQARERMIEASRREYKETGFIWFNGVKYHIDRSVLHKEIREIVE